MPQEIDELHEYGITRIYHPDDGRKMGLQGMINDLVEKSDFETGKNVKGCSSDLSSYKNIARLISAAENFPEQAKSELDIIKKKAQKSTTPILGITGTGGLVNHLWLMS